MVTEILGPEERKKKREQIASEIITTGEVEVILDMTRVRINQLVKDGRLKPIHHGTFLKDDIYAYKHAFEEARANNKWLKDWQ